MGIYFSLTLFWSLLAFSNCKLIVFAFKNFELFFFCQWCVKREARRTAVFRSITLHCFTFKFENERERERFPTECEESLVSPAELIMQQPFFLKLPQIYVARGFFLNKRDIWNEIKRSRHVIWDSTSSHIHNYKLARKISISSSLFTLNFTFFLHLFHVTTLCYF